MFLLFLLKLKFAEYQEKGPLHLGDRVEVVNIAGHDDLYGVLVNIRFDGKDYVFPLCDLQAVDEYSPNSQPIMDYSTWFANRLE